jgi:hypothetical protein
MAIQKMLIGELVFCFVAKITFPKERNPICQSTSSGVTTVERSLNFS